MHDSELIRRYTLDRAGIMFVTGLFKDLLTSPTPHWNAMVPEIDIIPTLTYLAIGKMQICSSDYLGLYLTAPSEPYRVSVHLLQNTLSMTAW